MKDINDLTYAIRGAIFEVRKALGPGLLENVYEAALIQKLSFFGLNVVSQQPLPVQYKNVKLELGF